MKAFVGFAGFGLVDLVLREAGFDVIGVEIDPAIAEVNRINGGHCLTADILDIRPEDYIDYDLAHFSPPCPSFSLASQSKESLLDIALARWVARFVAVVQPQIFTLENVWAYRGSESWAVILKALTEMGYGIDWWHLNMADYGVAQTRKRMIAIARLDGQRPQKPAATHRDTSKDTPGQLELFETLPAWLGWYQAIEDLIPSLPESQFALWQMDRLPTHLKTFLMMTSNTNRNGVDNRSGRGVLDIDRPANTVASCEALPRALLLGQGSRSEIKNGAMPADTVTANTNQTGVKAFICDSGNTTNRGAITIRFGDDLLFTVTTMGKMAPLKAFVAGGQHQNKNTVQNRRDDEPLFTVVSSENGDMRAAAQGRIVSMAPRALARFQGIPDSFQLPENRALACYGIGNAVPPPLYRAVLKSLERR
jgi:DNA-cytosine methyltransferase